MINYESQEAFRTDVKRLNALFKQPYSWKNTQAIKGHTDQFGNKVKEGEVYYKRSYGMGYDDELKLSKASMQQILIALFSGNEPLCDFADEIIEQRQRTLIEKQRKIDAAKSCAGEE